MKTCSVCKENKFIEEDFYFDTATDRYMSKCKKCTIEYVSQRRNKKKSGIVSNDVKVIKTKKLIPTVIEWGGKRYVLDMNN